MSVIVADDEQLAREEFSYLLNNFGDVEIIATADNGLAAADLIEKLEPDAVFLDVEMPGLDGLGVIRRLTEKQIPLPYFVLATAYDQYAVEAFRLEAVDYLLKPVDTGRLAVTIDRIRRYIAERPVEPEPAPRQPGSVVRTKVVVRSAGRNLVVDANDLIYATIEDGVVRVVAANVEGATNYRTIEELQESLDPEQFWRAHRSYLVNINRIREVIPWFKSSFQIRMDDRKQTEIPVSRVQTRRLRSLFKL